MTSRMSRSNLLLVLLVLGVVIFVVWGLGAAYLDTVTIYGTVTNAEGAPIGNASITLAGRSTFSDANGRFRLQAPRGAWQLFAFADGYQPAAVPVDASDWFGAREIETSLVLEPNAWRGTIVAADTGKPLAGAQVKLGGQTLVTDAHGEFIARGVPYGVQAKVELPGYRSAHITAAGEPARIALEPEAVRMPEATATFTPTPAPEPTAAPVPDAATATPTKQSFKGRLVDAVSGKPISAARAWLGDLPVAVAADGALTLEMPGDAPVLRIKAPGYRVASFEVKAGGAPEFRLEPFQARGIHLHYGISQEAVAALFERFKGTQMNAAVFDVKESPGLLLWDSQVPLAKEIGAFRPRPFTAPQMVELCRAYQLYCIARVTVFKDSRLAQQRPDLALHAADGSLLYENEAYWTNPAAQEVQDYHLALAQELVALGFDEIQFDYIRYPGTRSIAATEFGDAEYRLTTIAGFLERAAAALASTNAFFSGDVFGLTTATEDEQGIGQVWERTVPHFDYISPMLYPSTWRYATYLWGRGIGVTNCADAYTCPYDIIRKGVEKARARTTNNWTLVRPWLQAYGGAEFGLAQYLEQARGALDAQSDGYLFWNNVGLYPEGLFPPATAR